MQKLLLGVCFLLSGLSVLAQSADTIVDSNRPWYDIQEKLRAHYSDTAAVKLSAAQRNFVLRFVDEKLTLANVVYLGFDGAIHRGQLICHRAVAQDIVAIFDELFRLRFPVYQCKPIADFRFDDIESMLHNNTTCFDFRPKTNSRGLSRHAYGLAIDINPVENPYKKGSEILPSNSKEEDSTGRIRSGEETGKQVIAVFRKYGWRWGGSWTSLKDYMHFEK